MLKPVNEGTTAYLTVQFRDDAGAAAAPASVQYRIDCLTTGQPVRGSTAAAPAAACRITLTASDNAMRVPSNAHEIRRVTVIGNYGTDDQVTLQFDYQLKNLQFV